MELNKREESHPKVEARKFDYSKLSVSAPVKELGTPYDKDEKPKLIFEDNGITMVLDNAVMRNDIEHDNRLIDAEFKDMFSKLNVARTPSTLERESGPYTEALFANYFKDAKAESITDAAVVDYVKQDGRD